MGRNLKRYLFRPDPCVVADTAPALSRGRPAGGVAPAPVEFDLRGREAGGGDGAQAPAGASLPGRRGFRRGAQVLVHPRPPRLGRVAIGGGLGAAPPAVRVVLRGGPGVVDGGHPLVRRRAVARRRRLPQDDLGEVEGPDGGHVVRHHLLRVVVLRGPGGPVQLPHPGHGGVQPLLRHGNVHNRVGVVHAQLHAGGAEDGHRSVPRVVYPFGGDPRELRQPLPHVLAVRVEVPALNLAVRGTTTDELNHPQRRGGKKRKIKAATRQEHVDFLRDLTLTGGGFFSFSDLNIYTKKFRNSWCDFRGYQGQGTNEGNDEGHLHGSKFLKKKLEKLKSMFIYDLQRNGVCMLLSP